MAGQQPSYDVIVLGAGAAGMMCAFEAGRRGCRVLLLDNGDRPGRKILISGGGRCNFTNTGTRAENFLSDNPHFAKSALARFTPVGIVALVEKHGIRYHEKKLGQLFCDDSARLIVAMLERECAEARVEVRCNASVTGVDRDQAGTFFVQTTTGKYRSFRVVVATGGLSIPKLGATGVGYDLARSFGHSVVEPRAALVPLVLAPEDRERWCDLTGLSAEVIATTHSGVSAVRHRNRHEKLRTASPAFHEKLLVTHRGLSGPAVLQISSYWKPGMDVSFDLAPEQELLRPLFRPGARRDSSALINTMRSLLPQRLTERWVMRQLASREDWTNAGLERLEAALHAWSFTPAGTEGFGKAEVTAGGVSTHEIDARTLQSQRVPGLYFIGEVVDVTGWLGGYNFQWAWASAVAAAEAIGKVAER